MEKQLYMLFNRETIQSIWRLEFSNEKQNLEWKELNEFQIESKIHWLWWNLLWREILFYATKLKQNAFSMLQLDFFFFYQSCLKQTAHNKDRQRPWENLMHLFYWIIFNWFKRSCVLLSKNQDSKNSMD